MNEVVPELEVIEEYTIEGRKRFRVKLRGTKVVVNVSASSPHEAASKAAALLIRLGIIKKARHGGAAGI